MYALFNGFNKAIDVWSAIILNQYTTIIDPPTPPTALPRTLTLML